MQAMTFNPAGGFRRARHVFFHALLAVMALAILGATGARAAEILNDRNGIAMHGYDVVAYFKQGKAAKGDKAHQVTYKGKPWYFSSAENAADFKADPSRYEPQFNGFCAYGVSEGYAAKVDFKNAWSIRGGKLYLNYNASVRRNFLAQFKKRQKQAVSNWPTVRKGLADGSIAKP